MSSPTASTGSLCGATTNRRLQAAELIALLRGEVDAIYLAGGRGPDLEALVDVDVVFDLRAHPDRSIRINNITPAALTVSGQLLDDRPDLVARYVAATVRAARWARGNAVETRRIVAREVGIAEDFVPAGYTDIHTILEPTLDEVLIRGVESQKDFLLRHGFIADDFDVRAWIDPAPLEAAHALLAEH